MAKTVNDMQFEMIRKNFDRGLWSVQNVALSVKVGRITPEQFKIITGEDYTG